MYIFVRQNTIVCTCTTCLKAVVATNVFFPGFLLIISKCIIIVLIICISKLRRQVITAIITNNELKNVANVSH